ncbi:hypothetical protein N0V85_003688 [Neurospora sp. IMI 360204]|nr:hypothetical protein N0V85_003688 [Neurospora sp. IMI 360204]
MPPKPAEGSTALRGLNPTQSEIKLLYGILENLVSPIDANWELAAAAAGLKDTKSCKKMWRRFRVKYGLDNNNPEHTAPVSATKKAVNGADGAAADSGTHTPAKKGRGRPPPKKMLLTPAGAGAGGNEGDDDVALATTPGTAIGNLSFNDVTPETPSKSALGGTATKRSAAEADPDAEETPAKKKPAAARKPRLTAKQKAAAAAAAAQAATDAGSATGDDANGDSVDVAMEGISQAEEAIADTLAAAAADAGYTTATEEGGGGVDFGEI